MINYTPYIYTWFSPSIHPSLTRPFCSFFLSASFGRYVIHVDSKSEQPLLDAISAQVERFPNVHEVRPLRYSRKYRHRKVRENARGCDGCPRPDMCLDNWEGGTSIVVGVIFVGEVLPRRFRISGFRDQHPPHDKCRPCPRTARTVRSPALLRYVYTFTHMYVHSKLHLGALRDTSNIHKSGDMMGWGLAVTLGFASLVWMDT